jgi:hypothetical protein
MGMFHQSAMPLDEKLRSNKGSLSFEVWTCHKGHSHYRLLKPIYIMV